MTVPIETCACGAVVAAADRFCEACGASLAVRTAGPPTAAPDPACPACGAPGPGPGEPGPDGYCTACGLRLPEAADRVESAVPGVAGVSDRGLRHARNEDAMAVGRRRDGRRAAVVCDGVSSSPEPERASRAAADAALAVLLDAAAADADAVRAAVAAAADAVAVLPGRGRDAPSCTVVCATVAPDGTAAIGWVGDSRAYWLGAEPAQLTADHSWAAAVVARGLVDAATAARDPRAHALTGWLGPRGRRDAEVVTLHVEGPGVLLLCSDGMWNDHADAAGLAARALPGALTDPAAAAAALTAAALDSGGHDNITVVLLPVPEGAQSR